MRKNLLQSSTNAFERITQWQHIILNSKHLSENEKLIRINNFFNQHIQFINDNYLWGVADYWATPQEILNVGAGDCEDFSIAKYFSLIQLGIAEEKLRLNYVKILNHQQAHMVLTYLPSTDAVPLVLDSITPDIKPINYRQELLPQFSFNGSDIWLAELQGNGKKIGKSIHLTKWADLKQRMTNKLF